MGVDLTLIHWLYLLMVIVIVVSMTYRKDTAIICTIGIFILSLVATGDFLVATSSIFSSFLYTFNQLLSIILVISVIVGMTQVLNISGVNKILVTPFSRLIQNDFTGYWIIGITIMVFSWFFWPSPAVALVGAFLLPAAIRVGLPPIAVAISMNLFGHGIALSGDYLIQGTPKLTSEAANIPIADVMLASVPLVIVMGLVTTLVSFYLIRRDMKNGHMTFSTGISDRLYVDDLLQNEKPKKQLPKALGIGWSICIVLLFSLNVFALIYADLQGDEATALILGTSILILIITNLFFDYKRAFTQTTEYLVSGFQFAFKVFTPVIPIASFFYLGGTLFLDMFGEVLPYGSQGIINDFGVAISQTAMVTPEMGTILITAIGIVSGLDGSGYSGIALIGQLSHIFVGGIEWGVATLSSLGQIVAIWIGGGTVVPWAILPAAAICGVDPIEVARRNLIPVMIGLVVTTLVAMLLIRFPIFS
ncbi:hypothetical protein [Thermoactinomyces sp. DSM 45892]|uniref:hypothetical protein n=1 Tax=Thermoactinomyces sp. DSM 45892 TaxID=1882753 RepID=UPI000895CE4B|nr:hypothetical protein [Thermoactinomyces sp. DSM 45892]SDZ38165.1 hypothetical protein SAMN05444416_1332 [Thermoactinomyces sp. DSM 45892]